MAGADPTGSFSATEFRAGIELAIVMSLPNAVALRPTFRWIVPGVYADPSPSGFPYDLNESSSSPAPLSIADLQANAAVQFEGGQETGTVAGFENSIQVMLTLLDTDYDLLVAHGGRPPDQVLLAEDTYSLDRMTQVAIFTVDIYTIYATAVDQA